MLSPLSTGSDPRLLRRSPLTKGHNDPAPLFLMSKRRFILGTAGHVDHGKTRLVSHLTGWDTDRLKEEKERGISIELGFAPLVIDDISIGIVDVPGHERFVKNMVAGAGGIDMAILVVAADEGAMPQTREHLEVLTSLAVEHGVVVLTKSDLAPDTRSIVYDDVAELTRGTFLESAPVIETSAVSGAGMDDLKQALRELAQQIPERPVDGPFRLAVDRVFHKDGIGVVVTGSCYSGTIAIGDALNLLPSEKKVRVREIQSFGEKRDAGYAGERLAVALQGGKLDEVARGDMLVTPSVFDVSYMLDVRIHVARYAKFELKQRERVRVHHGAREVLGRVVLLNGEVAASGESHLAQLRLEKPIVAGEGDFFVLRKYSPSRVVGGGRVIDPKAAKHKKNDTVAVANLQIIEAGDPVERMSKRVQSALLAGVLVSETDQQTIDALVERKNAVVIDKYLFDNGTIEKLAESIHSSATTYNKKYPLRFGIDKEELRQRVKFPHPSPLFNRVLEHVAQSRAVFLEGAAVRANTDNIVLAADTLEQLSTIESLIKQSKDVLIAKRSEVQTNWKGPLDLEEGLTYLRESGAIEKIGDDWYIHRSTLDVVAAKMNEWFSTHETLSVPEFKDLFDVTRKHAIPLLEYLDEKKCTIRRDNVRMPGPSLGR